MRCALCDALEHSAETHEQKYINARGHLEELAGTSDVKQFNRVRTLAEDARLEYELARRQLEQHQKDSHGAVN